MTQRQLPHQNLRPAWLTAHEVQTPAGSSSWRESLASSSAGLSFFSPAVFSLSGGLTGLRAFLTVPTIYICLEKEGPSESDQLHGLPEALCC